MKKIVLIIEKSEGMLWGRVERNGWLPTPYGNTLKELINNLKELVADYAKHEGKSDRYWNNISWSNVELDIRYDLVSFFELFPFLNLSAVATKIGINRTLLNHYKTGTKYPSAMQAKKIEDGIHSLASELSKVKLVA